MAIRAGPSTASRPISFQNFLTELTPRSDAEAMAAYQPCRCWWPVGRICQQSRLRVRRAKCTIRYRAMESVESDLLDPAGWLAWNGETPNSNVVYGEYQNTGPGSRGKGRVSWSSQICKPNALKFTVDSCVTFILRTRWDRST